MRIVCMVDSLISGGFQRQLCTFAVLLKKRGHDVSMLTYHPHDFFLPMLREADIPYTCLERKSRVTRLLAIRAALRSGSQEVALVFQDGACLYAELAALPHRRWGLVVQEGLAVPGSHKARLPWRRWLHSASDYVITNSHTNRLMLEQAAPRLVGKSVTVYNVVDLENFSPGQVEIQRFPRKLRFVVAARLAHQKNAVGLIEALDIVRREEPELDVTVDWYGYDQYVGKSLRKPEPVGSARAQINDQGLESLDKPSPLEAARARIRELELEDKFRLHQDTQRIRDIYREADAVVLPSFYEGLPNTICEGMGCGRPILMSNVCDAEVLVRDGENGFLFDPASPPDIAWAIRRFGNLSVEEREAMGARSRTMAEEMFHPAKIVSKYEEILSAAIERKGRKIDHWVPTVPPSAYRAL